MSHCLVVRVAIIQLSMSSMSGTWRQRVDQVFQLWLQMFLSTGMIQPTTQPSVTTQHYPALELHMEKHGNRDTMVCYYRDGTPQRRDKHSILTSTPWRLHEPFRSSSSSYFGCWVVVVSFSCLRVFSAFIIYNHYRDVSFQICLFSIARINPHNNNNKRHKNNDK